MRRFRNILLYTTLSLALFMGAFYLHMQLTGNFHEVIPGKFYRSAQLSQEALEDKIKSYGIKTIINLRGRAGTYYNEEEVSAKTGVKFVEFPISARQRLTIDEMNTLTNIMRDANGPILVHCKAGADRTGLATALYLKDIADYDDSTAGNALLPIYGHFSIPYTGAYAMDESWSDFLNYMGSTAHSLPQ